MSRAKAAAPPEGAAVQGGLETPATHGAVDPRIAELEKELAAVRAELADSHRLVAELTQAHNGRLDRLMGDAVDRIDAAVAVGVDPSDVLDFRVHADRIVVVTRDGRKLARAWSEVTA